MRQITADIRKQLGPCKCRAIELWRIANELRTCCIWQEPPIEAAVKALDQKAMSIAKDNGFEYDDVSEFVD